MSISSPFIRRPVATSLLTIGLAMAGGLAFFLLPVSPMPNVDFPVIVVSASLPGASSPLRGYRPNRRAGVVDTSSTNRFKLRRPSFTP